MAAIEIHITGLERVLGKLTPELYRTHVGWLVHQAALHAEREARNNAPKDTGALARSITTEVLGLSAHVSSQLQYASVMEEGRRPGASMPPPQALIPWMRRHGIDARFAFVVARAIARRGIQGRFFMRRAVQSTEAALPGLMAQAQQRIAGSWQA